MKLGLWFLVLILSIKSFGQENDFQDSLNKLSSLSAVISGLSILEKDTNSPELIEKLTGFKGVDKLISTDIKEIPKKLKIFKDAQTDKTTDNDKTFKGIEVLEELMKNPSDIKNFALSVDKSVSEYEQLITKARTDIDSSLKPEPYQSLISAFEELTTGFDKNDIEDVTNKSTSLKLIKDKAPDISSFISAQPTDKFKNLLSLITTPFNNTMALITTTSRIQGLNNLSDSLSLLSVDGAQEIMEVAPVINDLSLLISDKVTDNIDNVEEALMDPWIKKLFPDFEKLENLINPKILPFSKKIQVIKTAVDKIRADKILINVSDSLRNASEAAGLLTAVENPHYAIRIISDCLKNHLKASTTHLNPLEIQKAQNYTWNVQESVRHLEEVIKRILKSDGIQKAHQKLSEIGTALQDFTENSEKKTSEVTDKRDKIMEIDKDEGLITTLKDIKTQMELLSVDNLTRLISDAPDWGEVRKIQKVYYESKLDQFLNCLTKESERLSVIRKVIRYTDSASRISDIDKVISWVRTMEDVKRGFMEIGEARRRRKRNLNLQIQEHIVEDLSKGVDVLRSLQKTYENRQRLQNLLNDPTIQTTLVSVAPNLWTSDNLLSLRTLISDLEALNALSVANDSLSEVFKIFPEAAKVTGAQVDVRKFKELLSAHPDVRKKFDDLELIRLDFSRGTLDLKAASMTLPVVLEVIEQFFGDPKNGSLGDGDPGTIVPDSGNLTILFIAIGAILLLILVAIGGWLVWRRYRTMKRWKNRDKYWSHAAFRQLIEGDNVHTNFVLAARNGNVEAVRGLIKLGAFVDINYLGYTALHTAVDYFQPQILELLIRAGATRDLRNVEKETPLDLLYLRLNEKSQEEWQKRNLANMKTIFEKYEYKKFQQRVPELLSVKNYGINVQGVYANHLLIKFRDTFKELITTEDSDKPTTHYVVDINFQGIYDVDHWLKDGDNSMIQVFLPFFTRCVLVGSTWIEACLQNRKHLHNDYEHRVQRVLFRGKVYESMDEWKKSIHRQTLPFLRDIHIQFLTQNPEIDIEPFKLLIETCGAQYHETVFNDQQLKSPSPYFHPNLPSRWIVCGEETTGVLKSLFRMPYADTKSEYNILQLSEFFEFLLERKYTDIDLENPTTVNGSSKTPTSGTPTAGTPKSTVK